MSRKTASEIVSTMLEDFAGDYEERAGGPKDMWRQGGFKKFSLKGKDFGGKRPGEADKPVAKDEDDEEEKEVPKPKPRFSWTPPKTESLLQELGGHYCFKCQTGTRGQMNAEHKLVCEKCGSELQYPKSSSLRSRENQTVDDKLDAAKSRTP